MARYSYRASDAGGQICTGVREAQSRADVLAWLTRQQLVPLNLIEEKSAAK
ncbi:MAG TPA: pilus assembly protein PilC, partial [Firmicutes bacterium]|nr:pilus assembly protein PilC [Bacillota bacterium]HBG44933.1 pilus assembly protein PilC [Bacillota bacterium]HBL69341.1 pilus assembly protein PilC [Bacillota bacterium]